MVASLLGILVHAAWIDPRFAFVSGSGSAEWIAIPELPTTGTASAPADQPPVVEFSRTLEVPRADAPLRMRIEALRGFEVALNGRTVAEQSWRSPEWKRARELTLEGLLAGENRITVRVRNPTGPALLRLVAEAPGVRLRSDASWQARRPGEAPVFARRADDRRRAPQALTSPRLSSVLVERARDLLLILACGGLIAFGLRKLPTRLRARWGASAVAAIVALLWGVVLAAKATRLPEYMGFDGPDHLAYVQHLLLEGSLPFAGDGPQTHHPPLFYFLSAALLWLFDGASPRIVLRVLPFVSGLAQILLAVVLARCLFPSDRLRAGVALVAAGVLPLNLYMSAYLSNEGLHAALAALAIVLTTRLLLGSRVALGPVLGVGGLLGLAILTKVSSLLLVPVASAFLMARARWIDGRSWAAALLPGAAVLAGSTAVAGWYFVRNQLHLGSPLVGNWDVPGSSGVWWQSPGFHTPSYYLSFGAVFERPFFASFESFWDGLYSTFWGDGLVGGVSAWAHRHPLWDYELMTLGYALALPATALLVFGVVQLVRQGLGEGDPRRRAAFAFLSTTIVVIGASLLLVTLRVPAYSMTKASYALSLTAPLAVAFADGFAQLRGWLSSRWAGRGVLLLDAWAAALVLTIVLSFAS